MSFSTLGAAVPDVRVDASRQFQAIDGFGATFNEAGWSTLNQPSVSAAQRSAVLDKLFSPTAGAGFSIARTPIGSDDFSLSHYSYDETANDFSLNDFSVAHDEKYLIPYIKAAQDAAGKPFRLMASPWTAPSWMKNNGSLLGQPGDPSVVAPSTDARYYQAYADYFKAYVAAYKAQGIAVTDVSVQNEPENPAKFEATTWTDKQMAQFVGGYLGPDLTGTGTKIRVYEHNQDHWYYPANVLNDPMVAPYAAGADFHPYECDFGQDYCDDANLDLFNQAAPGYSTWMSEHTDLGQAEPDNYIRDEKWGKEIVKQMLHGEDAYIYWNMVLDQNGGPVTDLSAPQEPLVEVDTSASPATVSYLPKFYELAQFSKFVHPGAHRIGAEGGVSGDDVAQTAFENPDGQRVLVVVNSGPATSETVGEGANGFTAALAAHSTTTFTWTAPQDSYSIDSGATDPYIDVASAHFTGDRSVDGGTVATTSAAIANTADDALYQSTRDGVFSYALTVPSGRYRVKLLLSDNTSTASGQRVFNVTAEGATRLANIDPYALAGGGRTATSKSFDLNVTDGTLNLATVAVTGTPTIAGIQVTPIPSTGTQHHSTVSGGVASGYTVDTGVLPGTVFAQDYNDGGPAVGYTIANPQSTGSTYRADGTNIVTTTDTTYGGGQDLTGLSAGDKLNYTVKVLSGGNYDLKARVSSSVATGKFQVLVDGQSLGTVSVPNTNGSWANVPLYGVRVPAGIHTLTFVVKAAGYDFRYLLATRVNGIASGAVIEAEDYSAGGEGVGYHDTTAGNSNTTYAGAPLTGYYRGGDVDLEPASVESSQPDNFDVGSTDDGEWLRYDIYAATAGNYDISARVASAYTSGKIAYALDSRTNVISPATLGVPNTNGFQTWISEVQKVTIPQGTHALYVLVQQGGFNLDRLTIVPSGQGWAKTVGFGSSYAAGPGVSPSTSPNSRGFIKNGVTGKLINCERSRWNQVNYLADRLGQRDQFYDAACPGDKSGSIANATNADGSTSSVGDEISEATNGYRTSAPGSGALGTGTSTVTVSIGGNDVYASSDGSYKGSVTGQMYACFQQACVDSSGNPTATNSDGTKGLRADDITVDAMTTNLRPIVDQILAAAPNAKIRFISYPSVFGTGSDVACSGGSGSSAWAYTADETQYLQGLLTKLTTTEQTVLNNIAAAENLSSSQLSLVDIRQDSQDHGVCEPLNQRWISQPTGDSASAPIHPNLSMFAMEAKDVSASL
ncbi:O-glycosyl hydrolase [Amnibacterium kyonggiense]|uniref:O-glycosyl hydrolase n=1 Tax=Amnibacterium kyonggiense TaxID=595671 RepID=A0A4R7FRF9_9MICO|nr:O-glycosyl hydrolase [Amnibacterium kyonggiense]